MSALDAGLRVLLIDEQPKPGGQVWRAKSEAIKAAPSSPESRAGDELRNALTASDVEMSLSTRVWQIQPEGDVWKVYAMTPRGSDVFAARSVILATGAQERVIPVPGWTTPGVFGVAGATALFKEHKILPGHRVVVAGCGPLLPYVAHEIVEGGGRVVALVDLNSALDWSTHLGAFAMRPDLALRGMGWLARLKAAGVPIFPRHGVRSVVGSNQVEAVRIGPVDSSWAPLAGSEHVLEADALCLGHGLMPSTDASRLLGLQHAFTPHLGGWHVLTDAHGRTSTKSIYACGDGAGILGVAAAPMRGKAAAFAAAADLGRDCAEPPDYRRTARFGAAMTSLSALRPGILNQVSTETIVCRCEGLTRAAVEGEIKAGGESIGAVKAATRCGMGPCGGRFCSETAALITARLTGEAAKRLANRRHARRCAPCQSQRSSGNSTMTICPYRRLLRYEWAL